MVNRIPFEFRGDEFVAIVTEYWNNHRTAIVIERADGTPFATLSCNVVDQPVGEGEFVVKNWGENEDLAAHISRLKLFEDTGRVVNVGHMPTTPIWRLRDGKGQAT